jgi:uncharacterized protein (TIGR00288 family)
VAEHAIAVLVDFENMARPGSKSRGDFDIHLVLNRLAEKGRVLVKRAYADWGRYREAKMDLQNAGLELIEMPSAREGAKNRADIKLAVDAMELAYSREHVDNFVIVSGDSDFTPLVGKLRELNKRVTGMGNRESASELLIANCDEFIYYESLAATAGGRTVRRAGGARHDVDPVALLQETLTALQREGVEWALSSVVKDSMRRKDPAFDEADHGFSTFSKFLEDAAAKGILSLETDPRSGTYRVELAEGQARGTVPVDGAAPAEGRPANGEGRRRRRRRRSEPAVDAVTDAAAVEGGEVFEFVVTPREPEFTLPPSDQPLTYEDMIMLGPEVDAEVPDLAEASDIAESAPPTRSARRRRRRSSADEEPMAADLADLEVEPLVEAEVALPALDAAVEEAAQATVAEAPVAAEEPAPAARRRRVRRGARAAEAPAAEPVAEEPAAEAPAVEEPAAEPAVPEPEPEPAPEPSARRRPRRRAAAAAEPEAAAAPVEAPAPEPEAEEAPKPKRRTRRKAAEPEAEAAPVEAPAPEPEAEEAPKPKRRTRRKAPAPEPETV